jgi:hypothetical protein
MLSFESGDGSHPAESFLDPLADASADMPGWRVVHPRWRNGGSCLSDMRRPVDFAQLHDEVGGIEEPLSPSRVIASDLSAPGSIISIAASRSA